MERSEDLLASVRLEVDVSDVSDHESPGVPTLRDDRGRKRWDHNVLHSCNNIGAYSHKSLALKEHRASPLSTFL